MSQFKSTKRTLTLKVTDIPTKSICIPSSSQTKKKVKASIDKVTNLPTKSICKPSSSQTKEKVKARISDDKIANSTKPNYANSGYKIYTHLLNSRKENAAAKKYISEKYARVAPLIEVTSPAKTVNLEMCDDTYKYLKSTSGGILFSEEEMCKCSNPKRIANCTEKRSMSIFYNKTVSVNRMIGGIKYVCETCGKPTSSSVTIEEEFNCVVTKGSSKNTYEGKKEFIGNVPKSQLVIIDYLNWYLNPFHSKNPKLPKGVPCIAVVRGFDESTSMVMDPTIECDNILMAVCTAAVDSPLEVRKESDDLAVLFLFFFFSFENGRLAEKFSKHYDMSLDPTSLPRILSRDFYRDFAEKFFTSSNFILTIAVKKYFSGENKYQEDIQRRIYIEVSVNGNTVSYTVYSDIRRLVYFAASSEDIINSIYQGYTRRVSAYPHESTVNVAIDKNLNLYT